MNYIVSLATAVCCKNIQISKLQCGLVIIRLLSLFLSQTRGATQSSKYQIHSNKMTIVNMSMAGYLGSCAHSTLFFWCAVVAHQSFTCNSM